MLWSIDETRPDGVLAVEFAYFERPEPLVWDDASTYVETDVRFTHTVSHSWNHGMAEIITALTDAGLGLTQFVEHDSVPWPALPDRMVVDDLGEYRLVERPWRLPMSYTLQAVKAG